MKDMIKSNELRIGNLITYKTSSNTSKDYFSPCYVEEIQKDFFIAIDEWDIRQTNNDVEYFGLPLTEEWLIKFGFEDLEYKNEKHFQTSNKMLTYVLDYQYLLFNNMILRTEVEHVHQLQNLYFALTGEELTIKED